MPPQTIRGAVATRNETSRDGNIRKARELTEEKIRKHAGWFAKVAPRHVEVEQFVELGIAAVRRGSPQLHTALWQHAETFFDALAECARLGLVPGTDQFYMVPFRDNREKVGGQPNPDRGTYSITPVVGYKGMLDMIWRTGTVAAVHDHVVRKGDHFVWAPGLELPVHEIPANEWGQRGLGGAKQREFLTGVWAFAVMVNGGHSKPAVLGVDEVLSYRARSAAARRGGDSFWGPTWPEEGPDTHMMWRKTSIRRLYNTVPHSTEYQYDMARALAAAQADPIPVGTGQGAIGAAEDDAPDGAITGTVVNPDDQEQAAS
jgi:recombination protein RecT